MAEGIVFDIQRFSVSDGPGIRTTVFLKGCPLSCRWCHNPEGKDSAVQIRFFKEKCLGCGRCTEYTVLPPEALAGKAVGMKEALAVERCPSQALKVTGERHTPQRLVEILERDRDFYGETGGVTFSGGEPTDQVEFLEEMLKLCREKKLHTALDTCGYASPAVYERLLPLCDLVLFDIKGMDEEKHQTYTGCGNTGILQNFQSTAVSGKPLWVRIPLIVGLNANRKDLEAIADFLKPYREAVKQITLIPYHSFGNGKYKTLNLKAEYFPELKDETVNEFEMYFQQRGFTVRR